MIRKVYFVVAVPNKESISTLAVSNKEYISKTDFNLNIELQFQNLDSILRSNFGFEIKL